MVRVALAVAYEARRFDSYARQPGRHTVEGVLVDLLVSSGIIATPRAARFASGSRTDKEVSALRNVVAFDSDVSPNAIRRRLRPAEGLWILGCRRVPDDFNPRFARRRRYVYFLPIGPGLRAARLRSVLRLFVGSHDFRNFCRPEPGRSTERKVDRISVGRVGSHLSIRIEGPNFLWQQIRRMVAAAKGSCEGRWSRDELRVALRRPSVRRDFGAAPARHLILEGVDYRERFGRAPPALWRRLVSGAKSSLRLG